MAWKVMTVECFDAWFLWTTCKDWSKSVAKHLKELMKKVDAPVVAAARVQADQEIFELRLAQLRQTVEMSQHDLAVALGISQPSVANLEKRGHEVKISSLKRYVEALGGKLSLDVELADGRHIGINV